MIYYCKKKPAPATELDRAILLLTELQLNEDKFKDFHTFCDVDEVIYSEPRNQKLTTVFPSAMLQVESNDVSSKLSAISEDFIVAAEQFNIIFPLETMGELHYAGKTVHFAMVGFIEYTHLLWILHQIIERCEMMFPLATLAEAIEHPLFKIGYAAKNDRYNQVPNTSFSPYWVEAEQLIGEANG
jgi:hypothetical protein